MIVVFFLFSSSVPGFGTRQQLQQHKNATINLYVKFKDFSPVDLFAVNVRSAGELLMSNPVYANGKFQLKK